QIHAVVVDPGTDDPAEVVAALRARTDIPVIVVSERGDDFAKVAALDAGADDYVAKPFSAPELLARLRAALRRQVRGTSAQGVLQFGARRVELARRESRGPDGELHLTPLEYRVLECLARQLGSIVRQRQLICEVWGPERQDDSRSLRVCIRNLRAKLEPDPRQPRYLVTETGIGYRLRADEEPGAPG
ncbi:MAG TPA: winged helix-turn-helix domain-containing protein, partial [Candidatus Dormibacteraeota bacterium]|nr:winged helix-turn-helix domain-containing protein [Candidatus Dormibacteraeota bacterium]